EVESVIGLHDLCRINEYTSLHGGTRTGIAIQIHIHRIATGIHIGTVGIEHGYEIEAGLVFQQVTDAIHPITRRFEEVKEVHQRHGSGWFITVHLRPQHHPFWAATITELVDRLF